jgi:hypothetical protein
MTSRRPHRLAAHLALVAMLALAFAPGITRLLMAWDPVSYAAVCTTSSPGGASPAAPLGQADHKACAYCLLAADDWLPAADAKPAPTAAGMAAVDPSSGQRPAVRFPFFHAPPTGPPVLS